MMKIHENLLKNTAARVEKIQYTDYFTYPLAKPIVSGETYTFSFEGELDEGVTAVVLYNSRSTTVAHESTTFIANVQVKDNRKFFTFVAKDQERQNVSLRIHFPPKNLNVLNWMAKVKLEECTEPSDIWTPAHSDLTPEQIATLPPYGEYKEIQTF